MKLRVVCVAALLFPSTSAVAQDADPPAAEPAPEIDATPPPQAEPSGVEPSGVEPSGVEPSAGTPEERGEFFDATLDQLLGGDLVSKARLYGYARTHLERVFHIPVRDGSGNTDHFDEPMEWTFPNFHLYGTAQPLPQVRTLFNLFADNETVELRNAYGNLEISEAFQIRAGLMYRRFDLFNEKLDQIPTFLGIESPELFDDDHLMVPRNTLFAIHGVVPIGTYRLEYMIDTDNSEGGAVAGVYPVGLDVRVKGDNVVAGASGYLSNLGTDDTPPSVALGEGPAKAGVLPWMRGDRYFVLAAFAEIQLGDTLMQAGYAIADHSATRDPESVLTVVREAGISPQQRERFLGAAAGRPDAELTVDDVVTSADYMVHSFYLRLGHTFNTRRGRLTPYAFLEGMKHPEAIANKTFGGENEAGLADNGRFWKPSIGVVYKPYEQVAIKADSSVHVLTFNGATEAYPEFRFDISYAFNLLE